MAAKNPRPSQVRDDITKRLRSVLDSGRVTQSELARLTKVPQSAISMAVTGYRPFNRVDVLDTFYRVLPAIERRKP